jgi:hypothetical protein
MFGWGHRCSQQIQAAVRLPVDISCGKMYNTPKSLSAMSTVGGRMQKILGLCAVVLLCVGCHRGTVTGVDDVHAAGRAVQVVVLEGLTEDGVVLTRSKFVRIGSYYDFHLYDSLWISLNVTRMTTTRPFDDVDVKVGPAYHQKDTVFAAQENVMLRVKVSDISKPQFCALTFLTSDSLASLRLSGLRVIGWMTM